jgi:hypothetical protein
MLSQVWGSIRERLTAPPLALKVHAALVLAAGVLVSTADVRGWAWTRIAILAIVLWPLLRGSRLVWWVQLIALLSALWSLYSVYRQTIEALPGLSTFVDERALLIAGLLLGAAVTTLLLPQTRKYAREEPGTLRNALAFGFAALILASFPASALGIDAGIPHWRSLDYARRGTFLGADPRGPVAFYGDREGELLCLITIEPHSTGRSCSGSGGFRKPGVSRSEDLLEGLIPKSVTSVEVLSSSGRREAVVIHPDRFPANVYYLIDPPAFGTGIRIRGYDAAGEVVFDTP